MCVWMHVRIYVCEYVCMYVYMYVFMYVWVMKKCTIRVPNHMYLRGHTLGTFMYILTIVNIAKSELQTYNTVYRH